LARDAVKAVSRLAAPAPTDLFHVSQDSPGHHPEKINKREEGCRIFDADKAAPSVELHGWPDTLKKRSAAFSL
jgi:hypothetical protein